MLDDNDLQNINKLIDQRATATEEKIIRELSNFIQESVLDQIDDKTDKSVTNRLDNRIDHLSDKVQDHENRIKILESATAV